MWNTPMYNTSRLTVELRDLVESGVNIWDFEYPSFYEGKEKSDFEKKVIDHYYFRQIGQETTGRFIHAFRTKVREIMPYYIRLYKSVKIMDNIEDPFGNVDITETFRQTSSTNGSESSTGTSTNSENVSGTLSGTSSNDITMSGNNEDNTTTSEESESTETLGTNTTTTKTNKESRTDAELLTTTNTHRFSNTPQGNISNLTSYLTEASEDISNNSRDTDVDIEGESTENIGVDTDNFRNSESTQTNVTTGNFTQSNTSEGSSESTETRNTTSEGNTTTSGTSETSGTLEHTFTKKGNQGVNTYAHDMKEYREIIIDVDMMVINALNDVFLGVY